MTELEKIDKALELIADISDDDLQRCDYNKTYCALSEIDSMQIKNLSNLEVIDNVLEDAAEYKKTTRSFLTLLKNYLTLLRGYRDDTKD